jgi:hypothetical protein
MLDENILKSIALNVKLWHLLVVIKELELPARYSGAIEAALHSCKAEYDAVSLEASQLEQARR